MPHAYVSRPAVAICIGLVFCAPAFADETPDEFATIVEAVGHDVDLLSRFRQLERLTEELAIWQTMAILGGGYDWTFQYSLGGSDYQRFTLRLSNALDETEVEAIRALQAIKRSRSATPADLAEADAIYARHLEMREIANEILVMLRNGEAEAAADLYRERAFPLRKDIVNASYSEIRMIESRIAANSRRAVAALP